MAKFGTFFSGRLGRQERACLASFVRLGHDVTVFGYDYLDLPLGVTWRDAGAILPFDRFYRVDRGPHRGGASQFTELFRYTMIKRTGLVWIDTDVFCLRADWPEDEFLFAWQDGCLVNGAVLSLPRDHLFLDDAIEATTRLGRLPLWAFAGPHLLTVLVQEHQVTQRVRPSVSFYPVQVQQAAALVQPVPAGKQLRWPDGAYCVHFWNETLRRMGYDKAAGPAPGSPMAMLFDLVPDRLPPPG